MGHLSEMEKGKVQLNLNGNNSLRTSGSIKKKKHLNCQ